MFFRSIFAISFIVNKRYLLNLADPVYVQVDRKPPRMSFIVFFTFPLYGTSTVLPSLARYSATPP